MTIDGFVKALDSVTKLIGVLVWPTLLAFALFRFRTEIGGFMSSLSEFSLKAAGFEASAKRQTEAAAALGAASASRTSSAEPLSEEVADTRASAKLVTQVVTPRVIRRAAHATILWVDDRPDNNVHERQSLEALGVTFVLATSTDEALQKIERQPFDAIISDMGRPPDPQAGYTLLDKLHQRGNNTPFIIYAGSRTPEHIAESRRRGAIGCTNRPDELFQMVISALQPT